MAKILTFDAISVSIEAARNSKEQTIEVLIDTTDEVLNNFDPHEIAKNYDRLEELYEDLKEILDKNEE